MSDQSEEFKDQEERKQVKNSRVPEKNRSLEKMAWQNKQSTRGEAGRSRTIHSFEMSSENFVENGANLNDDHNNLLKEQSPVSQDSKLVHFADNTSTKEFTTQNQESQDMGCWEGKVIKQLFVEEIKEKSVL